VGHNYWGFCRKKAPLVGLREKSAPAGPVQKKHWFVSSPKVWHWCQWTMQNHTGGGIFCFGTAMIDGKNTQVLATVF
jgi:hypothetical protein